MIKYKIYGIRTGSPTWERALKITEAITRISSVEHIELLTNGHMALEIVMWAVKLEGEVITVYFTFTSTTHAIVRNGLKHVFYDINKDDFTMHVSKIESLITDRICRIVPVYGNICNIEQIEKLPRNTD